MCWFLIAYCATTVWKGEPQGQPAMKPKSLRSCELWVVKVIPIPDIFYKWLLVLGSASDFWSQNENQPLRRMDPVTCNYCGQGLISLSHVVWLRSDFLGLHSDLPMLRCQNLDVWIIGFFLFQGQAEFLTRTKIHSHRTRLFPPSLLYISVSIFSGFLKV